MENRTSPVPGWIVQLTGHEFDFCDWERYLKRPSDPWCERIPHNEVVVWALRSSSFDCLQMPDEVKGRAMPLIQRLNGALGVEAKSEPLNFYAVGRVDDQGRLHLWVPAEGNSRGRSRAAATGEARDAIGNLIPPPQSEIHRWIEAAEQNDDMAEMLAWAGQSKNNWYNIYKTLELAEKLVGGEHKMKGLLGDDAYKRMRSTANYYRHSKGYPKSHLPKPETTLKEAMPLLSRAVKAAMSIRKN